jgi:hypothetical protein
MVKAGTRFQLLVPDKYARGLSIGWGSSGTPGSRVVVNRCDQHHPSRWLVYAGGYWVNDPACVSVIVEADGKRQRAHIGVGKACRGQKPPAKPSAR